MKNTVIFDMDGLLVDTESISYQLFKELAARYQHNFTMEKYVQEYSGRSGAVNVQHLIDTYELPISLEDGLWYVRTKEREYFQRGVELKVGAKALLHYLKKHQFKILLASSSTRERAIVALEQNQIGYYFHDMVFGTEVEYGKPHPDIFLKARERAGEPAECCLVLEDSENGIQAAHSAGIDVIAVPDIKVPRKQYQDMTRAVCQTLDDVILWLEEENRVAG